MLPDQVPGSGEGVWAPFFGKQALTMTLAGRLARQTGVAVILTAGERLPSGKGWRIHYVRLPEPLPTDPQPLATAINSAMEQLIRRFPQQYLWSYNRSEAHTSELKSLMRISYAVFCLQKKQISHAI